MPFLSDPSVFPFTCKFHDYCDMQQDYGLSSQDLVLRMSFTKQPKDDPQAENFSECLTRVPNKSFRESCLFLDGF